MKCVVLAAGDFAGNKEMVIDILDQLRNEAEAQGDLNLVKTAMMKFLPRDGSGIKLGLWAGGHTIRSVVLRGDDLVFQLDDPHACGGLFDRSALKPRFAEPTEVHLRLTKRYKEADTLLRVLTKILRPEA